MSSKQQMMMETVANRGETYIIAFTLLGVLLITVVPALSILTVTTFKLRNHPIFSKRRTYLTLTTIYLCDALFALELIPRYFVHQPPLFHPLSTPQYAQFDFAVWVYLSTAISILVSVRAWLVFYDLSLAASIMEEKWSQYIVTKDDDEYNWFIRYRTTWGNTRFVLRIACVLWVVFNIPMSWVVWSSSKQHSATLELTWAGINIITWIILWFKMPQFDDFHDLQTEIEWNLKYFCPIFCVFISSHFLQTILPSRYYWAVSSILTCALFFVIILSFTYIPLTHRDKFNGPILSPPISRVSGTLTNSQMGLLESPIVSPRSSESVGKVPPIDENEIQKSPSLQSRSENTRPSLVKRLTSLSLFDTELGHSSENISPHHGTTRSSSLSFGTMSTVGRVRTITRSRRFFQAFMGHLLHELSHESLLFLVETSQFISVVLADDEEEMMQVKTSRHWVPLYDGIVQSEIVYNTELSFHERGKKLFDKYVSVWAPLEINVSGETRKEITEIFENQEKLMGLCTKDLAHVFDACIWEILSLMKDSLSRFRFESGE